MRLIYSVSTFVIVNAVIGFQYSNALLFPRESETREVKDLDGVWHFRIDNSTKRDEGFVEKWWKRPLYETGSTIYMPVPSSYNDITQEASIRDFIGWAWYDKEFYVPSRWDNDKKVRVVMRVESCHYYCIVWCNGEKVMQHEGGHLPFEADVGEYVNFGSKNRITVAANNTLDKYTLPPGSIQHMTGDWYPPNYFVQLLHMDFFNYAGIHRSVKLYTTPTVFLENITIHTEILGSKGIVKFWTVIGATESVTKDDITLTYVIRDKNGEKIVEKEDKELFKGSLEIPNVNLWWPIGMQKPTAYLYELEVTVESKSDTVDTYRLHIGVRTVSVNGSQFLINNKPFYFQGFGKHEDSYIRGRGFDYPLLVKDFNLMKWLGGNAFRTSHYPYAEEVLQMADAAGMVVIDESPGVGIYKENMGSKNLHHHLDVMREIVSRDHNHPSVVMWSVANEPRTDAYQAGAYFKTVIKFTKSLDHSRPVTFVTNQKAKTDKAVQYVDVIACNRYYGWYHDPGHIELISRQLESELTDWYNEFKKPVIQSEYGAGAVAGLLRDPPVMFSESYQVDTIKQYFPVFDKLRKDFFVGEMIWAFADFQTDQGTKRVGGNKKGILTRERQPKSSAYTIRDRYLSLLKQAYNSTW